MYASVSQPVEAVRVWPEEPEFHVGTEKVLPVAIPWVSDG